MATEQNTLVFSGIQPTGSLTLGNYLGALKQWVALQDNHRCIYCIVDQHAITTHQDPKVLRHATQEVAAGIIASGVSTAKTILFPQSANPNHTELGWYFNCIARMGWLNRMTQFKEKSGKNAEESSVGLFAYPNLQTADILLYKATHVPVGADQKQHLELCRDIATKFNHTYKRRFFPLIKPLITDQSARIMSLKDAKKKMSKSDSADNSRINLLDDVDTIARKIRKATSDAHLLPGTMECLEGRPEAKNLLTIFATLQDKSLADSLHSVSNLKWSAFKEMVIEVLLTTLVPIGDEMRRLLRDRAEIDRILHEGAVRSRHISQPVIEETRKILGLLSL